MNFPVRVVFDVNVLFSWVGWYGNAYRCVELARQPQVISLSCEEILRKLTEKLVQKLDFTPEIAADVIQDILSFTVLVTLSALVPSDTEDPEDDVVVACAVNGNADYIVSGDRRHLLPLREYQGIRIISPADFVSQVATNR